MEFFLHELVHFSISLLTGWFVWKKFKQLLPSYLGSFLGGFLLDSDHLIDYILVFGSKFRLNYFLESYEFLTSRKVYVFFHAWEWVIALILLIIFLSGKQLLAKNPALKTVRIFLIAFTLAMALHLFFDSVSNDVKPVSYSLIYRLLNNFNADKITR